jgi:hypothetical protein
VSAHRGYLSTLAAFNGAKAARKKAGACSGAITPGITRRPKPLIYMRAVVSAVGCMPLLCGPFDFILNLRYAPWQSRISLQMFRTVKLSEAA